MTRKWTDEQKQTLRDNCRIMSHAAIAELMGLTAEQVKNAISRYGFSVSRQWPAEKLQVLRELYPDTKTATIATKLGYGLTAVYRMANKLGLKKSDAFNASEACGRMTKENCIRRGYAHRFPKGHVPFNKGTKGVSGQHDNCKKTQFKKGQLTHNRRAIGDERTIIGYVQVKVADGRKNANWRLKHWIVWEAVNGSVPPDHLVAFKDGDPLNFDLENLELISRKDWMKRHTWQKYPEDVKAQIHILAGFKRRLNSHAKKQD